jgi:hypothetical protein
VLKELNGTLEKCLPPKISQSSSEINEYTTFQNDSSHSHIVSTSKEMLLEAPAAEYPGAELLTEKVIRNDFFFFFPNSYISIGETLL